MAAEKRGFPPGMTNNADAGSLPTGSLPIHSFPADSLPAGSLSPGSIPADGLYGEALIESVRLMARLRRVPDGCPWDLEQTFDSIKKHTLEETYEVFDAIERRDWQHLKEELGDLLLQVLFYAQMAADAGYFNMSDVAQTLNEKLVRRHPHIFPDATGDTVAAANPDAVLRNWEQIKQQEKSAKLEAATSEAKSMLDDVPRTMPAMMEAQKLGSKASKVGFDWPDASGLFAKMDEEIAELMVEVEARKKDAVEAEFGDLLFTAVNLARHLKVDPESALRRTNAKFRARFAAMESVAGGAGALRTRDMEELEALWAEAKRTVTEEAVADAGSTR
jgi:ATP diphosphatase